MIWLPDFILQSDRHGTEGGPLGCCEKDVIEDRHRPTDQDFRQKRYQSPQNAVHRRRLADACRSGQLQELVAQV